MRLHHALGSLITATGLALSAVAAPADASPTSLPLPEHKGFHPDAGERSDCEPIVTAYYRTWRDKEIQQLPDDRVGPNVIAMTDIPHNIDVLSLIHVPDHQQSDQQFWATFASTYLPELHRRGTKVLYTLDISAVLDPSLKPTSSPEEYAAHAQRLVDKYVRPHKLDGLDIDMERDLSFDQRIVLRNTMRALTQLVGPFSNTNTLLTYNTNRNAQKAYIDEVAQYVNYVFVQTYSVTDPNEIQYSYWNTYRFYLSSCQFLPSYANPEEFDRNRFLGAIGPVEETAAVKIAGWQPFQGGVKGGIMTYAIDRDGMTYDQPDISTLRVTTFPVIKRVTAVLKAKKFAAAKETAAQTVTNLTNLTETQRQTYIQNINAALTFEDVEALVKAAREHPAAPTATTTPTATSTTSTTPTISSSTNETTSAPTPPQPEPRDRPSSSLTGLYAAIAAIVAAVLGGIAALVFQFFGRL
ncbi:GA module [Corynebacterium mustelae]|uniref:mannosyl-glycoprotein endo-beta-N-acetylglucosaminidase n=1 Tax=Corynebacterium mustelae TaxID=571915 RepID=A0A0G3GW68_9CORY|nr:GA module-containing protein [Corynebacterium mustelae]AKK05426.1 GA module [Corynebacterium mustelae]